MAHLTPDTQERPYAQTLSRLRSSGLRPTRQRLALGRLLFDGGDRHVTAEALHEEAQKAGVSVSLATVYNTLHQFTEAGLLREVVVDSSRTYFDTNVDDHHHFFFEDDGRLMDISGEEIGIERLPSAPEGTDIARVDVIVRLQGASQSTDGDR
ncbi:Fur family iron response transcriptional regulator [Parvibaculum indicum]|uniref:iron response transcriptional regulator IrrA n=1 Tax=Parvibaculum indicum TaxID=562969 RepID=UPI00141E2B07|nr:Fur family transcriptional regulator [Parvibaculum indicum]NIJ42167.1 Fur family iron response transcriptional regulator [Parvibaculum indicum]